MHGSRLPLTGTYATVMIIFLTIVSIIWTKKLSISPIKIIQKNLPIFAASILGIPFMLYINSSKIEHVTIFHWIMLAITGAYTIILAHEESTQESIKRIKNGKEKLSVYQRIKKFFRSFKKQEKPQEKNPKYDKDGFIDEI